MFSILMMVQINVDATTTDFKVGGIINNSCAENVNGDWVSCNEALGTGNRWGVRCSTCASVENLPFQNEPNLCNADTEIEG